MCVGMIQLYVQQQFYNAVAIFGCDGKCLVTTVILEATILYNPANRSKPCEVLMALLAVKLCRLHWPGGIEALLVSGTI